MPEPTDLRTLAADAMEAVIYPGPWLPDRTDGRKLHAGHAEMLADAALAAVLPVHRAQVLDEAARTIENRCECAGDPTLNDPCEYRGMAALARGLAATAPLTLGLSPWYVMHSHGDRETHAHSVVQNHDGDWPNHDHRNPVPETETQEANRARYWAEHAPPAPSEPAVGDETAPPVPDSRAEAQEPTEGDGAYEPFVAADGWREIKPDQPQEPTEPAWKVTGWYCRCHDWTWQAIDDERWVPYSQADGERVDGHAPARSLDDLRSTHPDLTPVAVDDVAALIAERDEARAEGNVLGLVAEKHAAYRAETIAERDRLADERDEALVNRDNYKFGYEQWMQAARRYEPVIEAAKAWYAACDPGAIAAPDVRRPAIVLGAAIAALDDADADRDTELRAAIERARPRDVCGQHGNDWPCRQCQKYAAAGNAVTFGPRDAGTTQPASPGEPGSNLGPSDTKSGARGRDEDDIDMTEDEFDARWARGEPVEVVGPGQNIAAGSTVTVTWPDTDDVPKSAHEAAGEENRTAPGGTPNTSMSDATPRYECFYCHLPIERGDRCLCGRGWLVVEVPRSGDTEPMVPPTGTETGEHGG